MGKGRWTGLAIAAGCLLGTVVQANSARAQPPLYNAAAGPAAPAFVFSANAGLDEILTDNSAETGTNEQFDASSLFSFGGTVSADTPRLTGILSATASYRLNAVRTDQDQLFGNGYASGRAIILPSGIFLNFNGSAEDIVRAGGGIQNSIIQSAENTHTYIIGASPILAFHAGDLGTNVTRYQIEQVWFANNTQAVSIPGLQLGPIGEERDQSLREDFRMAGTITPRLLSDISLAARENDSGNILSGDLKRYSGELMNEYELTRAFGIIFGAGYEKVSNQSLSNVNSQGAIWDVGARVRPNADSYLLLVYGRHDGEDDFAGQLEWRITPFIDLYANYSNSLTTAQQTLIGNNVASQLGPEGAVTSLTFDQSPLIGVLDENLLGGGAASDLPALGIPTGVADNLSPLQNGLFRTRQFSASARYSREDDTAVLTAYYVQNNSLSPTVPSSTIKGETLSWNHQLQEDLSTDLQAGYSRVTGTGDENVYQFAAGANYAISGSLALSLRYDLIWHKAQTSSAGYLQNAVTLGIHKTFD